MWRIKQNAVDFILVILVQRKNILVVKTLLTTVDINVCQNLADDLRLKSLAYCYNGMLLYKWQRKYHYVKKVCGNTVELVWQLYLARRNYFTEI